MFLYDKPTTYLKPSLPCTSLVLLSRAPQTPSLVMLLRPAPSCPLVVLSYALSCSLCHTPSYFSVVPSIALLSRAHLGLFSCIPRSPSFVLLHRVPQSRSSHHAPTCSSAAQLVLLDRIASRALRLSCPIALLDCTALVPFRRSPRSRCPIMLLGRIAASCSSVTLPPRASLSPRRHTPRSRCVMLAHAQSRSIALHHTSPARSRVVFCRALRSRSILFAAVRRFARRLSYCLPP